MQKKTVGIIGSLDHRIDYRLLHYLAQEMSDTRFHFIGRVNETDAALKLKSLPNVVFGGALQRFQSSQPIIDSQHAFYGRLLFV